HAARVRRYIESYGVDEVERLLDRCLSIDNLIDYNAPHIRRHRWEPPVAEDAPRREPKKPRAKEYMDDYINPKAALDKDRVLLEEQQRRDENFPAQPQKDVMLFLLEHAPLHNRERDAPGNVR